MKTLISCLLVITSAIAFIGCGNNQEPSGRNEIDSRSYNLGVIAGFAEVVDMELKELALSGAMSPEEIDSLIEDAKQIATKNNVEMYREPELLITDLFPIEVTKDKHVLLIYKGDTKQKYFDLKKKKKQLKDAGKYEGEAREEIARAFGKLLSYNEERINRLIKTNNIPKKE